MEDQSVCSVTEAVVLAAGNGDRFQNGSRRSKLLTPVAEVPLLVRTLTTAWRGGVRIAHLVIGYDADRVRAAAVAGAPAGMQLHFHFNPRWSEENGLSVLAARRHLDGRPFALLMGDHIVEPDVLRRLLASRGQPDEIFLCVDKQPADPAIAAEATKVALNGDRISAIGKDLARYDALDTGVFLCRSSIFAALDASYAEGDSTLSGGVRRLAERGVVRGVDIGPARWCDIDTVDDLAAAERLVTFPPPR